MSTALADVQRLGKLLLSGKSAALRAWAADALGESGLVGAYAFLRRAIWDSDEKVRESAVHAIGSLAVRQSAAELAALYAWSGPRLRRAVLREVGRIGYQAEFDGILALACGDPKASLRSLAGRRIRRAAPVRSA